MAFDQLKKVMKSGREYTTAQVGDMLWGGSPTETNWQKYTLPAAALLRRAEKKGIVKSRYDHGQGYGRTFWKLTESESANE